MNGNILIVGDFNIDLLNTNGSEHKQFCNIIKTFGFIKSICTETHLSNYLLDYTLERIEIFYQTKPSRTIFSIIDHFTLRYNVYVRTSLETDSSQCN